MREAEKSTENSNLDRDRWLRSRPFLVVSLALLVSGALAACKEETVRADRPIPVRVATVSFEQVTATHRYSGTVKARFETDLGFRVAGKIIERSVNIGDAVKAGQVIAKLDATDYKLNVEAQKAELAAAKSSRDAAVAAEQRYKTLKAKGWVAQAGLDERISAADEARSRVERAERALDVQRNQADYAVLKADRDGMVASLSAEAGQVVAAGQTVARIARLDELEAVVAIPEQALGDLRSATASVELWPVTEHRYSAALREVGAQADPLSRTFEARYTIQNPDANVRLGKTASVVLELPKQGEVARLPLSAVMNDANGPLVWVANASGDHIERRAVKVQKFEQDTALIESGLAAGERVVALGVHVLDANSSIRIVETTTANAVKTAEQGRQP